MSDVSQGPGWWQASDGKWYPPEQAPGVQPGAPTGPPAFGAPAYGAPAYGAPTYGAPGADHTGAPGPRASWGERVIATLIDSAFLLAAYILLWIVVAIFSAVSDALGTIVLLIGYVGLLGANLYLGFLNGAKGQTPGKALTGLKVVGEQTGQVIGGGQGVVRYIVQAAISFVTCGIGGLIDVLFPLWDTKQQTLHDKVVKTVVLNGQPKLTFSADLFKP